MAKRKVEIDIKYKKTKFIDGQSGQELTKEEFEQKHGKVKPNLQSGKNESNQKKKEEKGADKKDA